MKSYYDYVIVGAGPSGLALAQCLRYTGETVLLVDNMDAIGGCHRVIRVPFQDKYELFTEHGPRVYISNYKNFQMLLKDMDHDFFSLFTRYRFSFFQEMVRQTWRHLSFQELFHFAMAFFLFLSDKNFGKHTTVLQFVKKHHFQPQAMDMLDRACRMMDGSGLDRYSLNQLFEIINQQVFYDVYQPNKANDKGLFKKWQSFLEQHKNIDIVLEHDVIYLNYNEEINTIQSVWMVDKKNHNTVEVKCGNVILAVPPSSIARILAMCHDKVKNSFIPYPRLLRLAHNTDYIPYICITYHWDTVQTTSSVHGFPTGDWGIIHIVLSDYMHENFSKTLISTCVSYTDTISHHTNKTANQSTSDEVIEETFRQLKQIMPHLKDPTVALISSQCFYDEKTHAWKQKDVSYFSSMKENFLKSHGDVTNLFNVGTHNGNTDFSITTMESAVSNALVLAHSLCPSTKKKMPLQNITTLRFVFHVFIYCLLALLIVLVLAGLCYKKK